MKIKILFDSQRLNKRFSTGWGVSFLIDERVLFDTGEKPVPLFRNMENLSVKLSDIEAVVISHDHWDHTGGLWELLKKRAGLTVYACPHFSQKFKAKVNTFKGKLIELEKLTEVTENIFSTGEIGGTYKGKDMPEQSVVIKTDKGITLITGCAHPGIVKIVERVKKDFPMETFYSVIGGLHLINNNRKAIKTTFERLRDTKIKKIGATHCSGKKAKKFFKQEYENDVISIKVGQTLEV